MQSASDQMMDVTSAQDGNLFGPLDSREGLQPLDTPHAGFDPWPLLGTLFLIRHNGCQMHTQTFIMGGKLESAIWT